MLERIKLLLGLSDSTKDELLSVLIEAATEEAMNYTRNDCLAGMETCICQMVIYNYNRLGTEGVNAESYSGVNFSYSSDYPESIIRQLKKHRKLKIC